LRPSWSGGAFYGYQEGDYWAGVGQSIGQELDANWTMRLGRLFEAIVRTLGLNTFPDYSPQALRFVSRILGHGGIPTTVWATILNACSSQPSPSLATLIWNLGK